MRWGRGASLLCGCPILVMRFDSSAILAFPNLDTAQTRCSSYHQPSRSDLTPEHLGITLQNKFSIAGPIYDRFCQVWGVYWYDNETWRIEAQRPQDGGVSGLAVSHFAQVVNDCSQGIARSPYEPYNRIGRSAASASRDPH